MRGRLLAVTVVGNEEVDRAVRRNGGREKDAEEERRVARVDSHSSHEAPSPSLCV